MSILRNHYFVLFLLLIIGFWQVSTFTFSLHWDMLDAHLPWLYYLSECFKINEFHFWNPYQQLGYPFYADLQTTPYYPPALILAKLIGFNIYLLHVYFLAHLLVAGVGMLRLSKALKLPNESAFIAAIGYMLGGIFVFHAQHLLILTSAAFLPWVFEHFIAIKEKPTLVSSLSFSVVLYLFLSGGYPFISVICFYILLVLFIGFAIHDFRADKRKQFLQFLLYIGITSVVLFLLSLPLLFAVKEVMPFVARGNGINLDFALDGSYTLRSLYYFLIPLSFVKEFDFFETHPPMTSIYFGIILFCFFLFYLTKRLKKEDKIILAIGIICLLISFGNELPFRSWLFNYVPLMNYFRFPALFRIFSVIVFIILASKGVVLFFNDEFEKNRQRILGMLSVVFVYLLTHFFIAIIDFDSSIFNHLSSIKEFTKSTSFNEHVVINVSIQILLLIGFVFSVYFFKKSVAKNLAQFLIVIDMVISAQITINYMAVDPQMSPKNIYSIIENMPPSFMPPKRQNMFEAYDERIENAPGLWRNVSIFTKEPSRDAFSSFWLKDYDKLLDNTYFATQVLQNPPCYLSSKILPISQLEGKIQDSSITTKDLFISDTIFHTLNSMKLATSKADTAFFGNFGPNEFIIKVKSENHQLLTFMQSNFAGWKAEVNEKEQSIMISNGLFLSVLIPEGTSTVKFLYENRTVWQLFIFSSILFTGICLYLAFSCSVYIKK